MKLYLIQHGEAMEKSENPDRPLTPKGQADVKRLAQVLAHSSPALKEIRHSGKRRAAETAAILAEALHQQDKVTAADGLSPNDDVRPVAEAIQGQDESLMIVGHLPFLSRLASYVLIGKADQPLIQFQKGGGVCLEREEDTWHVTWMLIPAILS
ncbi:phosphohistidine phosphatase SixA [candidate division KSB3 bacterium]|uniref:Phosphohistidine phosphatase SixA n=1 Tax=candidate division KSB3 bacterium TaxID=2044937 RepID=A0A9D5JVH5_9BACT|nr:phosphohistidine phosphatase SixA [candidate division KSB3 bacterium]MBD3325029.1 phosphohistidine phosphatase SixA [candidate division KSB3 bacterium]